MMKTTFHQSNLAANRRRRVWLTVGGIFALIILVTAGGILNVWFGPAATSLARPLWSVREFLGASVAPLGTVFSSKSALQAENEELQDELTLAQTRELETDSIREENEQLRLELGLRSNRAPITLARVLSHPWESPYDVLLADLAQSTSTTKITTGSLVTYKNLLALGKVTELSGSVAKIILFSHGGEETPVLIGSTRLPATLAGRGNGNFTAQLPRSVEIKLDSPVFLVGPAKDFIIGTVGAITKKPGESLQTIYVRTPLVLSHLRYVEIHLP